MRLYSICLTYVKKNIERLDTSKLPDDILQDLNSHNPSITIAEETINKLCKLDCKFLTKFDIYLNTPWNPAPYNYRFWTENGINALVYLAPTNLVYIKFVSQKNGKIYGDFAKLNDYYDIL